MIDDHVPLPNLKQETTELTFVNQHLHQDDDASTIVSTNTDTTYNTNNTHIHKQSNVQQFNPTCPLCNKTFANSSNLKHHMNTIHFNEAKWICKECGKVCTSKSNLKVHLRVHLRVKPYYCRWCDYNCMHHSSIRDHLSKCHPDKSHNSCEPGYIFNSQAVPEPESSICEMSTSTLCALSKNQSQIHDDHDNNNNNDNEENKSSIKRETIQHALEQPSSRRRKRKLDNVFLNKFRLQQQQEQQTQNDKTKSPHTRSPLSPTASHNSSSVSPISTLSSNGTGSPLNNLSQLQLAQQQSNAFYLNNMAAAAFIHRMNTTAALMQQFNTSNTSSSNNNNNNNNNNMNNSNNLLLPIQQTQSQSQTTPNKKGILLKKFLKKSRFNLNSSVNPLDLSLTNGNYYSAEECENGDDINEDDDVDDDDDDEANVHENAQVEEDIHDEIDEQLPSITNDTHNNENIVEVATINNNNKNDNNGDLWSPESLDCKLKLKQALFTHNSKAIKCQLPSKITRDTQTFTIYGTNGSTSNGSSNTSSQLNESSDNSCDINNNNSNLCSYKCTFCNIIFNDYELYSLHMGMHGTNNPWQCNVCSSVCFNKIDFAVHILHLPKK